MNCRIFRQLPTEQSLLLIHGQLIEGSELVQILTESKFSMTGLSAVAGVNNVKGAWYTFQITLCVLFVKFGEAASVSETNLPPYDWLTQKSKDNTFLYWKCVIDLQIKVLLYVRSVHNYARWLTIHCFDLYTTEMKFSDVYNVLSKGNFSFQKSHREFLMGMNQIYEQNNQLIKGFILIYLTKWTIQPLLAEKLVVLELPV